MWPHRKRGVAFPTAQEKFYVKKNGGEEGAEDLSTLTSPVHQQSFDSLYKFSPLHQVGRAGALEHRITQASSLRLIKPNRAPDSQVLTTQHYMGSAAAFAEAAEHWPGAQAVLRQSVNTCGSAEPPRRCGPVMLSCGPGAQLRTSSVS